MLSSDQYEKFEKVYSRQRFFMVLLFYLIGCVFYMNMEGWTLIDSVYFITVTITSVGYGDLEPSSTMCRCFTIAYAIIGLGAIFGFVHEFITHYLDDIHTKALESSTLEKHDIKKEQDLTLALSVFAIVAAIFGGGVCYYFLEGWSLMDSVYFATMTTLTVGYGDLSVSSQVARLFSIFYMSLSVIVFAVAIGNFQAVNIARSIEERREAMLEKELDIEALFRLDEDGDGKVTLIEFVTGALHQLSGIDPEKEIHPWIKRFHELDADGNGYLDQNDLEVLAEQLSQKMIKNDVDESISVETALLGKNTNSNRNSYSSV